MLPWEAGKEGGWGGFLRLTFDHNWLLQGGKKLAFLVTDAGEAEPGWVVSDGSSRYEINKGKVRVKDTLYKMCNWQDASINIH